MSAHTLSTAANLFCGNGWDAATANQLGRGGAPIHLPTLVDLGTPALGDADLFVVSATGTELPDTETVTYTWATDGTSPLDNAAAEAPQTINKAAGGTALVVDVDADAPYGRNLVFTATHDTTTVAMTVLVSGYDWRHMPMTELFTLGATATTVTATGNKAFKYIESIAITAAADAEANTLVGGTGAKLGLPFKLQLAGHVLAASLAGIQELINVASNATVVAAVTTTATNATGDVRGTITFNGALDGSKRALAWMHIAGRNTAAGIAGVAQA
jgi:hypothetical protein